jgi:transposase
LYRLPKRLIEALFGYLFGIPISVGSVCKLQHRTSDALAHPVAELQAAIPHAPVVHADETGWKEAGQKMWLWLAATTQIAVFLIRPRRTRAVAQELLGAFAGWLVTDRFSSYGFVDASQRQVCWAHLLRDIEAFRLWGVGSKRLATAIQRPARKLMALFRQVQDGTLVRASFHEQASLLEREILYHLRRGTDWRVPAVAGTCRKILTLEAALFSFVHHDGVPPTNNHAERILRHAVVWRKISAGTDSARGSRFVERILSTVTTLRLQGRNVLDYLTTVCTAALHRTQPPSLLPHARASPCAAAA